MPYGWAEFLGTLHTFGPILALALIIIALVRKYMIVPLITSLKEGASLSTEHFKSSLHPTLKDKDSNPIIITRHDMITRIDALIERCQVSQCPIMPIVREEISLLRQEIRDHSVITAQARDAVLKEFENFAEKISLERDATDKDFRTFTNRVFESRNATHEEIVKIFDRFNSYVDGLGSRVVEALEKLAQARGQNGGQ
jgi:hypothetical protein